MGSMFSSDHVGADSVVSISFQNSCYLVFSVNEALVESLQLWSSTNVLKTLYVQ